MPTIALTENEKKIVAKLKQMGECKQDELIAALSEINKELLLETIAMMIDYGKIVVTLDWKLKLPSSKT